MNRLDAADLELARQTGIAVVACPQSNLRLGSGACPLRALAERGVTVGLGTGFAGERRRVRSARRGAARRPAPCESAADAAASSAMSGCALATLGGAVALGLGEHLRLDRSRQGCGPHLHRPRVARLRSRRSRCRRRAVLRHAAAGERRVGRRAGRGERTAACSPSMSRSCCALASEWSERIQLRSCGMNTGASHARGTADADAAEVGKFRRALASLLGSAGRIPAAAHPQPGARALRRGARDAARTRACWMWAAAAACSAKRWCARARRSRASISRKA